MAGKKARTISPEERLFGLTCNLMLAPGGLSTEEIRQLPGYENDGSEKALKAAEKMFERDKDILRDSGIHLEVVQPKDALEDNQTFRYRIPNESFEWPKDISFTARQLALLELASRAWAGASLGSATHYGMQRLRALGQEPTNLDFFGVAPRIGAVRHLDRIANAIESRQVIEFEYRKPGSDAQLRTIEPWQLEQVASQWLVVGKTADSGQIRRFLLKRIVSKTVSVLEEKYEPPTPKQIKEAHQELQEFISKQVVKLEIEPDTPAWFHFRMDEPGVASGKTYVANYMDLHLLAEELRTFSYGVRVLEPPALAEELKSGLMRTLEVHGG